MRPTAYRLRLYLLTALMLVGFGVLLNRLHDFQILRRDEFLAQVPGNREVIIREPGTRGDIVDRNSVVLAKNNRKYELWFNLEEIRDAHLARVRAAKVEADSGPVKAESDIVAMVKEGDESPIGQLKSLGLAKNFKASALRTHYLTPHPLPSLPHLPTHSLIASQLLAHLLTHYSPARRHDLPWRRV